MKLYVLLMIAFIAVSDSNELRFDIIKRCDNINEISVVFPFFSNLDGGLLKIEKNSREGREKRLCKKNTKCSFQNENEEFTAMFDKMTRELYDIMVFDQPTRYN
ncbi:hypothetical protein ACFSTE_19885 [Aquimarina hainanensis]|uniref:Uncharacterized protein n=1 Tax=Aquimarina hainanensis TaxID=1578017 RepID=A0ABW5NFX2_9FLAO|nr:hypothetical protein [Aquimarina sp. TRL1]QKX06416.1 hypothetical protein HN014_16355 [Aquimarina sp. TRL1]